MGQRCCVEETHATASVSAPSPSVPSQRNAPNPAAPSLVAASPQTAHQHAELSFVETSNAPSSFLAVSANMGTSQRSTAQRSEVPTLRSASLANRVGSIRDEEELMDLNSATRSDASFDADL